MFRQSDLYFGGWQEKTIESMQKSRFERLVSQMQPLSAVRLDALPPYALRQRIEQSWLDAGYKPLRTLQLEHIRQSVLDSLASHADCLSYDEHELVERALILGGHAQLEDIAELEAAQTLSLRLWADVGLVSGKPVIELSPYVAEAAARAFSRAAHERLRIRFNAFNTQLRRHLYCVGGVDDRIPQRMILKEVLRCQTEDELSVHLARRYLWASFDCTDYSGGVMLLHPALADPQLLIINRLRKSSMHPEHFLTQSYLEDILPEEIPLQQQLERAITGFLRNGLDPCSVARSIRYLCKQGAPLKAMEGVLQSSLIVLKTDAMRDALRFMYYATPKWVESSESHIMQ